ncbi:MAG: glycosyltransferase [Nocardioides sp.]
MSLPRLLARAARPTLVLLDPLLAPVAENESVQTLRLDEPVPADFAERRWGCVVVAVPDRAALRRATDMPARVGRSRAVVAFVASSTSPIVPEIRPEWPEVVEVDAHLTPGGAAVSRVRFQTAASAHEVLGQLGRDAGSRGVVGHGGLVVDGDAGPESQVPPDILIGSRRGLGTLDPRKERHPVTGRAPVLVADRAAFPVPVDEGVFRPAGFRRAWTRDVVGLPPGPATEVSVAGLRDAQGVWAGPSATAYDVAALALAGVPLTGSAPRGLDPDLAALVEDPVDLDDPLRREEHSVRLRRAAAAGHSTLAWRSRLAEREGVRVAGLPSVSILLATRRPEQLTFALTQVAKQAAHGIELVLATHGFEADAARVREHLGDRPSVLLPVAAETRFGDVLDAAARAASGDLVLKMDDDDWYGPDVVSDLRWARRTSGAELVGMAAEFVYLEPLGLTVRRRTSVEAPARVVAGGTMLLDRGYLRALGGFRSVTRFVDAQLLAAVRRAGGGVHRTQGLGYVLRRGATGHTWSPDLGYFLSRRSVVAQWRGFRPSALLSYDDSELPS